MRSIFCGNLEFDVRQSDVERLFKRYGRVDRVDMKSGFAFIYMEDERDAEDAIRKLDQIEFGRKARRLRVEWTKQERGGRKPDSSRKSSGKSRPSKTLFVINFDPINTRTRDIEKHFEQYGRVSNVRIRRNFAFVQFDTQEDATRALEEAHLSKLMDRVISVEYAIRDDDDKGNGYSPDRRGRAASPDGRSYGRRRSPSPYNRNRGSPDYGHGSVPNSRLERRDSPDYSRGSVPNSRSERRDSRSPDYGHGSVPNSRSERRDSRSPDYVRGSIPNSRSERRDSRSPDYEPGSLRNPRFEQRDSRSPDYEPGSVGNPRFEQRDSRSPDYEPGSVRNTRSKQRDSRSPDYEPGSVRNPRSEQRDSRSPDYERATSPASDRYCSPSPPARERSRS